MNEGIINEEASVEKGENARMASFVGAIAIADLVKSTLGPKGMDKILQSVSSKEGKIEVTNDGATILRSVHIDNAAAKVGLESAKPVQASGVKDRGAALASAFDALSPGEKDMYVSATGSLIYLSVDRYDIQYAVKECRQEAAKPTKRAQARLKRVARYLMTHRRVVVRYRFLTHAERQMKGRRGVRVFVDASHAGCKRTRKSTTSGVNMRGPHNLGEFVATQVPISMSSGESEFYALLRAAVEARFLTYLITWLEFDAVLEAPEIVSDATAAMGAAARLGEYGACSD